MKTERNRETEIQRHRESETPREGDTEDTHDSEDMPPLATRVNSLQEAVEISLKDGVTEKTLFNYARALKAFEMTTRARLTRNGLHDAFALWWATTMERALLAPDENFEESRLVFEDSFAKTKSALGSNSLEEAIRQANASPLSPAAKRYQSSKLQQLVEVCRHLQQLQGERPFFLAVRDAARIMGMRDIRRAGTLLTGIVNDGILEMVEAGTRTRAARYKFVASAPIRPQTPTSPTK